MSRGIGGAALAGDLPEVAVALAGLVTQLGDMWFVVFAIVAVYAIERRSPSLTNNPRRDCLFLLALAIGSYAFTLTLKHVFALPRPPGAATAALPLWLPPVTDPIYESMVTGDGYGFPSGHALKTTVVYGAAAITLDWRPRRRQLWGAGGIVVLVAASRVALGVHYIVDVIVGVILGVAFLAAVVRIGDRDPARTLLLAAGFGVIAFALSLTVKAALVVVVAVAGLGVCHRTGPRVDVVANR